MTEKRIIAILAVLLLIAGVVIGVLVLSDSDDDPGRDARAPRASTTTSEPAPTTTAAPSTATCTSTTGGFTVEYPAGWFVDMHPERRECALFDPDPIDVEPNTEGPLVAVTIVVEPSVAFADIVSGLTDPTTYDVREQRDLTVDGFPALLIDAVQTESLLEPAGTRWYQVVIDRPGATTIVYVLGLPGTDDTADRATLDAMVASLRFT